MIVVGLTGGIASGKSFVGALLRRRGIPVIDADQLARDVVRPGTEGFAEVIRAFPNALSHGEIDRAALGQIVFGDPEKRRILERIIHPRVHAEFQRQKELHEGSPLVVYEVPLLFERGIDREMDVVIVVDAPESVQKDRLMRRSGLTEQEASRRIAAQMSRPDRLKRADFILSGLLTEEETQEALNDLIPRLFTQHDSKKKGERA